MAFIPTADTVKVCLKYNSNGQVACNVFNVDVGDEPNVSSMTTLGALVKLWWDTYVKPITHLSTSLQQIELYDISSANDDGIVYTTGLPSAGTLGGGPMPNNVSVVTKLLTGLTGRSRRGRKYFVGISDSSIATGRQTITSTFQTALATAWNELLDALIAEGFNLVITSLISQGAPRTSGLNTFVTGFTTNLTLDSMRRRLPERGE